MLFLLGLVATATAANRGQSGKGQEGGPGTQTVLLIKGGVGFDVNLLSPTTPTIHRSFGHTKTAHKSTTSAVSQQAADLKSEREAAEDLTSQLRTSVSSADKVYGEIKSLREHDSMLEQKLAAQQREVDELKNELKKKELQEQKSSVTKDKMLLKERRRGDLLEKKVKSLEQDLEVASKAWREAAVHEKDVAQQEEEVTRDALAKVDRLETQNGPKPGAKMVAKTVAHRRPAAHAPKPKAKPVAKTAAQRHQLPRKKHVAITPKQRQQKRKATKPAAHQVMKRRAVTLKSTQQQSQPADPEPVSPMDVGYSVEDVAADAADAEVAPQEEEPMAEEGAETLDSSSVPEAEGDADVVQADEAPVQEDDSEVPNVLEQQPLMQANADIADEQSADEEAGAPAEEQPAASESIVDEANQQDVADYAPVPAAEDAAEEDASAEPQEADVLTPEAPVNSAEQDYEPLDTRDPLSVPEYDNNA